MKKKSENAEESRRRRRLCCFNIESSSRLCTSRDLWPYDEKHMKKYGRLKRFIGRRLFTLAYDAEPGAEAGGISRTGVANPIHFLPGLVCVSG